MNSQLKSIRRTRGLAIWGLSVLSGVSPSLVTAIEKWGYVPGSNTQGRIANALGVKVEEIWSEEQGCAEAVHELASDKESRAPQEIAQPITETR